MRLIDDAEWTPMILVAEDDDNCAILICEALNTAGFRTHRVSDGIDAINCILETKPDLIVLDLMLPRLEGYKICTMVRQSESVRNTPIVVISGLKEPSDKLHAFELGADDFVTKPFQVAEMIARVKAVLHRGQLQYQIPDFLSSSS